MSKRKSSLARISGYSSVFFKFKIIIFATLVGLSFSSCYNEPEIVGKNLLPDDEIYAVKVDTSFKVSAYTVTLDSLNTYGNNYAVIGDIRNDVFGSTNAGFAFEVGLGNYTYFLNHIFFKFPTADSAVISLKLFDKFNSDINPLIFRLYELNDTINYENGFESMEGKYLPSALSTASYSGDSILKFYLPLSYVQNILNFDSVTMKYDTSLQKSIKGYYIKCDPVAGNGGNIYRFNLTSSAVSYNGFTIYFHNVFEGNLSYKFSLNTLLPNINIFNHDYSLVNPIKRINSLNDTINQDSVFYLQGLGGVRGLIKLDDLAEWAEKMPIIVHRAELRIEMENNTNMPNDSLVNNVNFNQYRLFDQNWLTGLYYEPLYDYSFTSDYSALYIKPKNYYSFDITNHLQQLLKGKITKNSFFIETENFDIDYNQTVLRSGKHSKPIKLIITYSKLK